MPGAARGAAQRGGGAGGGAPGGAKPTRGVWTPFFPSLFFWGGSLVWLALKRILLFWGEPVLVGFRSKPKGESAFSWGPSFWRHALAILGARPATFKVCEHTLAGSNAKSRAWCLDRGFRRTPEAGASPFCFGSQEHMKTQYPKGRWVQLRQDSPKGLGMPFE